MVVQGPEQPIQSPVVVLEPHREGARPPVDPVDEAADGLRQGPGRRPLGLDGEAGLALDGLHLAPALAGLDEGGEEQTR